MSSSCRMDGKQCYTRTKLVATALVVTGIMIYSYGKQQESATKKKKKKEGGYSALESGETELESIIEEPTPGSKLHNV